MQKCRSCNNEIQTFFSLGMMPLVNSFLAKDELKKEKKYELAVAFCPKCYLVQLTKTISPEELFEDYIYFSSTSQTIIEHSRKTASYLTKKLKLTPNSLVLEIASNDGVLLQFFKKLGIRILGVDPAKNIAKIANEKGIKTIPDFFNFKFAQKLASSGNIHADLIYGANVFAHVPEIVDFLKGVKTILKNDGTAIFEFPYLEGLLENKFDTIYHEHVFYYSLIALENLVKNIGLEIYNVEFVNMQGGSLRIFISHSSVFPITDAVSELRREELKERFDKIETYRAMNIRVKKLKKELIALLQDIKAKNKTIVAYGAPAKGIILLNYFGIKKYLSFIVDKAPQKQNLYAPGAHMLIYSPEKINQEKPDYLLILCWNIADEVISQYKNFHRSGGEFIVPIPEIEII